MRHLLFTLAALGWCLTGCGEQEPAEPTPAAQADVAAEPGAPGGHSGQGKGHKGHRAKGGKAPVGQATAAESGQQAGVTFVVNTHDWYFHDKSAETLSRCVDILEKYGVHGEFYFTSSVFRAYQEHHPALLKRLQDTGQTISYHVRAPHPITYRGPLATRLESLPHDQGLALMTTLETHRLDLATGQIDESEVGGYKLLVDALGYAPPAVGINPKSDVLRDLELEALHSMGARMWVREHHHDTMELSPQGMLSRPAAFSVAKVQGEQWFNYNRAWDPAEMFAGAHGYGVVLIHEHDFYAEGPGWSEVYWHDGKQAKPPFDLTVRPQPERLRPADHVAHNWANWEAFVAYAAQNLRVVTSRDIIAEYDAKHQDTTP